MLLWCSYECWYDGKMWEKLNYPNKITFLPRNIIILRPWTWIAPAHINILKNYSVGVIYGAIINRPGSERFKREYLLIIGIIPSMAKEPPVQTFIKPYVEKMMGSISLFQMLSQPNLLQTCSISCCWLWFPSLSKTARFLKLVHLGEQNLIIDLLSER